MDRTCYQKGSFKINENKKKTLKIRKKNLGHIMQKEGL